MMNINSQLAANLAAATRMYLNDYDFCTPAEKYLLDVETEVIRAAMNGKNSCILRWCALLSEDEQIQILDELQDNYCHCQLDDYNTIITLSW